METFGENLLLIAIDQRSGVVRCRSYLRYGLVGAQLVALAEARFIDVAEGKIVVTGPAGATGDPDLDAELAKIAAARRPPSPRRWVAQPHANLVKNYLTRLTATGTIQPKRGLLPRYRVIDTTRADAALARLDAIVRGAGPADTAQHAYAGLVNAIGLSVYLYRGRDNRAIRQRLNQLTESHWASAAVKRAVESARSAAAAG